MKIFFVSLTELLYLQSSKEGFKINGEMSRRDSFGAKLQEILTMYFTYILKSLKDNKCYYGSCEDLEKRLLMHNAGKVRSTKSRIPFIIHYFEKYKTRSESQKREYYFKSIDGYNWLKTNKII